jgi:predicted house-cleaning noncanonical NTP pyrophosphatase (MazG superfamily)
MIKTYNKLVRDRIPDIIKAGGADCKIEILSDADYVKMIDAKLDEELAEYHTDQTIDELADLLEVIYAATKARGYTLDDLETVRAQKAIKRGVFDKKIFLLETIENTEDS